MKIHEFQSKELLKEYGISATHGIIVDSKEQILKAVSKISNSRGDIQYLIKAQVHAGGRGKAGGVKFANNGKEAVGIAEKMLGMRLITPQTGAKGKLVRKILIHEAVKTEDIKREFYTAITLDRKQSKNVLIVSAEGGVEIEQVAAENPDKIVKLTIHPGLGLRDFQIRQIARALSLNKEQAKKAAQIFRALLKLYLEKDASIVEINPLVLTSQGELIALDAKVNFDDNGLVKHPEIAELRDEEEDDPVEVEAGKYHLNFIKLEGNVGCMVNGAGLAMATMDLIKQQGGEPANFLDVGGGANVETVKNGFRIILADPNVKVVLINIFGGIVRCDRIAHGIIEAVKELELTVPVVVRLEGTNAVEAKELLANSDVQIISADKLSDATAKVIEQLRV